MYNDFRDFGNLINAWGRKVINLEHRENFTGMRGNEWLLVSEVYLMNIISRRCSLLMWKCNVEYIRLIE